MQNPDISRYSNDKPLVSNTNDATLKAVLKYINHPSIISIVDQKQVFKQEKIAFKARCK